MGSDAKKCTWPPPRISERYDHILEGYQCEFNAYPGYDYCTAHIPAEEKERKSKLIAELYNFCSATHNYRAFTGIEIPRLTETERKEFNFGSAMKKGLSGMNYKLGIFKCDIDFTQANFGTSTTFRGAKFYENALFINAKFKTYPDFSDVCFNKKADFRDSSLGEGTKFSATIFNGFSDFRNVAGQDGKAPHITFSKTIFNAPALFQNINLGRTRFIRVDLSLVSFFLSNLLETEFINCDWGDGYEYAGYPCHREILLKVPFIKLLPWKRHRLLFDEVMWRSRRFETKLWVIMHGEKQLKALGYSPDDIEVPKDFSPADVESIALQLKEALEKSKDPITASDFHFASMEMKRERTKAEDRRGRSVFLKVYKILSGYGERPVRTGVWIFLLMVGAWLAFMLWGDICPNQAGYYAITHILPIRSASSIANQGTVINRLHWIGLLESLGGILLLPLFVLALRNRFKR